MSFTTESNEDQYNTTSNDIDLQINTIDCETEPIKNVDYLSKKLEELPDDLHQFPSGAAYWYDDVITQPGEIMEAAHQENIGIGIVGEIELPNECITYHPRPLEVPCSFNDYNNHDYNVQPFEAAVCTSSYNNHDYNTQPSEKDIKDLIYYVPSIYRGNAKLFNINYNLFPMTDNQALMPVLLNATYIYSLLISTDNPRNINSNCCFLVDLEKLSDPGDILSDVMGAWFKQKPQTSITWLIKTVTVVLKICI